MSSVLGIYSVICIIVNIWLIRKFIIKNKEEAKRELDAIVVGFSLVIIILIHVFMMGGLLALGLFVATRERKITAYNIVKTVLFIKDDKNEGK